MSGKLINVVEKTTEYLKKIYSDWDAINSINPPFFAQEQMVFFKLTNLISQLDQKKEIENLMLVRNTIMLYLNHNKAKYSNDDLQLILDDYVDYIYRLING